MPALALNLNAESTNRYDAIPYLHAHRRDMKKQDISEALAKIADAILPRHRRLTATNSNVSAFALSHSLDVSLEHTFISLANRWKRETAAHSSIGRKVSHPDYRKIIGFGRPVIKFILRTMDKEEHPSHWFPALKDITQIDPVNPENRGDMHMMKKAWIDWGRKNGLLS